MTRKTVWIGGGLIVAIGVLAYLSYHQAPAVKDAAGSLVMARSVHRADMRNWLADGERGMWIQGGNAAWFYARFSVPCHGLNSTNSLSFDTGSSGDIDRTTSVVLPQGGRCEMQSFAPSAGPPENRNADVVPAPQTQ
jgi:hypothetical protein